MKIRKSNILQDTWTITNDQGVDIARCYDPMAVSAIMRAEQFRPALAQALLDLARLLGEDPANPSESFERKYAQAISLCEGRFE